MKLNRRSYEVTTEQFNRMEVGKRYRLNGQVGIVLAKSMPTDRNAAGLVTGLPTITVGLRP